MVRAKFKCWSNHGGVVTLHPVTDGSEENKTFWKYTPGGQITLTITNPDAVNQFEPGKEYYVDFTSAN
ncbi:hypothetical protein KZ483_24130 [Paenibacillus sp. sptzw28]|uniref:hypothetical protein n=1 Tax=Paenibacillus sp. sptzw28 TaxID=715179 RepID=UPI001C6F5507|nr:hypothetical protein [Paenibacillus sp. sptzw28]QYR20811.1 hypothetical protein KZ483_24130 [Paenibacillus sp. sptzw28]